MTKAHPQRTVWRPGLVPTVAVSLWLLAGPGCRPDREEPDKPKGGPPATRLGKPAVPPASVSKLLTETKLPDVDGKVRPLLDYKGPNGLVAVFVDTVCPSSQVSLTDMPEAAKTLKAHKVSPVVINIDEGKKYVLAYYKRKDLGAAVIYDETAKTIAQWKIRVVPTLVFFDARGALVYRGNGLWQGLAGAMEPALGLPAGSIKFRPVGTADG